MFERLAVLGAGAIGSVIGGYLSRAGRDVILIDSWSAHVEAMRQKGLRITAQDEEFTVPVKAVNMGEVSSLQEPFDTVFLCMKSYDTVWATHFILPHLKPTGVIVSAQNAMNDELIAPIVGFTREMGCVVTLSAGLYEPGSAIRSSSPTKQAFTLGELSGMPTQRAKDLAEMMGVIGPSKVTTNLWGERWSKLTVNSMSNPMAAVTGLGSAAVRQTPGVVELLVKVAAEVVEVARALGIEVEPINSIPSETYLRADDAEVMEDIKSRLAEGAKQLGEGRPSMLQDVLKGRRTEIDYLDGYVARKGKEVGVATPLSEAITELVKRVERGELKPDVSNLKYLQQTS